MVPLEQGSAAHYRAMAHLELGHGSDKRACMNSSTCASGRHMRLLLAQMELHTFAHWPHETIPSPNCSDSLDNHCKNSHKIESTHVVT